MRLAVQKTKDLHWCNIIDPNYQEIIAMPSVCKHKYMWREIRLQKCHVVKIPLCEATRLIRTSICTLFAGTLTFRLGCQFSGKEATLSQKVQPGWWGFHIHTQPTAGSHIAFERKNGLNFNLSLCSAFLQRFMFGLWTLFSAKRATNSAFLFKLYATETILRSDCRLVDSNEKKMWPVSHLTTVSKFCANQLWHSNLVVSWSEDWPDSNTAVRNMSQCHGRIWKCTCIWIRRTGQCLWTLKLCDNWETQLVAKHKNTLNSCGSASTCIMYKCWCKYVF